MTRRLLTCYRCHDPDRCQRLGCYAFDADARRLADAEDEFLRRTIKKATDKIGSTFRKEWHK